MSKYPGRIVTDLAPAGYSVFFDGTGDYLSVADNTALDMGGSDFTIEFWTYLVGTPSTYQAYFAKRANTGTYGGVELYLTSGRTLNLQATLNGSSWGVDITTTSTVPFNTWTHIAAVRNGNTWVVYVNGTAGATSGTVSGTVPDNANTFVIGAGASDGSHVMVASYISNFRVVKGTALYTAAFTPPTQLLNVTNTQLLTCNSPAIIDQSTNAFAITANGNAAVSTLTPFPAYVPYNPALGASTPGIWTVDEAMQAAGTRQWNMYDPSFNLTTLLLHGNGANNANNNSFQDSSSNNFPITRNGNTTQGSFSPFSQTGWSVFFNAADFTDIYAASSADFNFGSGNFTIECFFNSSNAMSTATFYRLFDTGQLTCFFYNGSIYLRTGGGSDLVTVVAHGLSVGVWYHLAFVRSSTTYSIYRNGSLLTSGTGGAVTSASAPFFIGTNTSSNQPLSGHVSNFRVTTGQALYTTTFTPTTSPLTTTSQSATASNVKLLTCQSNRFVDNSTQNTKTILFGDGTTTNPGTRFIQPFSPFYPTAAYTPQTIGGSAYLDGSGDYLTIADDAAFEMTADFTLELWFYCTQLPASTLFGDLLTKGASGVFQPYYIFIRDTGSVVFYSSSTGTSWDIASNVSFGTPPLNSWNHIAVSRSGSNIRMFLNGALVQTINNAASGNALTDNTRAVAIGARSDGTEDKFYGYISNVRIIKGVAVYTGAFTPPSAPLATSGAASASAYSSTTNVNTSFAASATSLLCNFTNAGIVDSTAKNVLETVGNAQISTTQSKFGGSSMYFDGNGDYLQVTPNPLFDLRASDFTVEFWIYPTSFASATYPLYSQFNRSTTNAFAFEITTGGIVYVYVTNAGGAAWSIISAGNLGTLTLNTWNHVAFVRNGTAFRGYVNGVQGALSTNSSNTIETFNGFNIGATGAGTSGYFTGYIDDMRISRYARYTAAFTPQTSQWQDQ